MPIVSLLGFALLLFSACTEPSFSKAEPPAPGSAAQSDPFQSAVVASGEVKKDVPYVPTSHETVAKMLKMARVDKNDLVYDLGSGDGRIVITAAREYGARGVGIDIDPERIEEANQNAKLAGVTDKVKFIKGDLFQANFRDATAVTLYLLPSVNLRLRPKLLDELRPGTPVVSHDFDMGEWEPDEEAKISTDDVFLWIIPAKVQGTWEWKLPERHERVEIRQNFQVISGGLSDMVMKNATLRGDEISFEFNGRRYHGRAVGDNIIGTVEPVGGGRDMPWMAQRTAAN